MGLFCTFFGPLGLSFWPFWANLWVGVRFKTFLEPTYVDNQLWFWKVSLIFSFLIWSNLGPFWTFWAFRGFFLAGIRFKKFIATYLYRQPTLVLEVQPYLFVFNLATFGAFFALFWALRGYFFGPLGLIVWLGSGSKTFLEPTYVDNQLWFWKVSLIFSFLIWSNLGPFWTFWAFRGFFLAGIRFKKFIATYLYRQPTLVLEVQPYLFVFNLATFGAFFALFWALRGYFFGPLGLIVWLGSGSKTFLEPTYVENQLWFWKYSPIFLFIIWPNLGPFLHFLGLSRLFLGLGSSSKKVLRPTYID